MSRIHKWTEQDINDLRKFYATVPVRVLAKNFGVSVKAIEMKARHLGLTKGHSGHAWSQVELEYLQRHYSFMPLAEIARRLGIAYYIVAEKARTIGLVSNMPKHSPKNVWTDEQLDYLKANFAQMLSQDIAKHLGVSYNAVVFKAKRIGLKKDDEYKRQLLSELSDKRWKAVAGRHQWSEAELEYLKNHFSSTPSSTIAEHLGLSLGVVNAKGYSMGLSKEGKSYPTSCQARRRKPKTERTIPAPPRKRKEKDMTWDDRRELRDRQRYLRLKEIERTMERYEKNGYPEGVDIMPLIDEHRRLVSQLSSFTVTERYRIQLKE